MRDLARRGSRRAVIAHVCALALIVLFSLQPLGALSGDALNSAVTSWTAAHPLNVPATISAAVSLLLVLCMDVGMLKNAAELGDLQMRRAAPSEKRSRQVIMAIIALVEAGTYVCMEWKFNHPANAMTWAFISVRAAMMPLLSIDLSLARAVPIGPRDMLYEAELIIGRTVIRDLVVAANDQTAPLPQKMALYRAAADLDSHDQERLERMIEVLTLRTG